MAPRRIIRARVRPKIAAVRALPRGTTWARPRCPAQPTPQPGIVEILGQRLPADQAQAQIAILNLQPVYLVSDPPAANAVADWGGMTLDQRRQAARQMANQVLNMDPALRLQYVQQQTLIAEQVMRQLPPHQHDAVLTGTGAEV